jgi:hypothetical protein
MRRPARGAVSSDGRLGGFCEARGVGEGSPGGSDFSFARVPGGPSADSLRAVTVLPQTHARDTPQLCIAALERQFREVWPRPDGETFLLELDLVPVYAIPAIPILVIARIIEPEPLVRDVRLYFDSDSLGLTAQSPAATASPQTRCNMLHNNDIDGTSVSWTSQLDRVPP